MPFPTKQRDSLNRRIRFAPTRQPRGKKILVTPDDLSVFEAIHRHGHLPTNYLRAFLPKRNENAFTDRTTHLYHGAAENGPYLEKPTGQYKSLYSDIQHLVYDLHPNAEKLLKDPSPFQRNDNHFVHALMNACVGASIELLLKEKGLGYIHRHEILARKNTKMELPLSERKLVPDDLFGISYGDDQYQFFAVEVDRDTESTTRKPTEGKQPPTIEKKFLAYMEVMKALTYRSVWGISTLMVLVVTTSEQQKARMKKKVLELDPKLAKRFLFKVEDVFDDIWRVPEGILRDILDPWERADNSTFDITDPNAR